ncbi:unnamed protein product [Oikopleura dioica]|uniref:Uncharacterized protein n=1 Tax=Oikopleura dioica TaxID=34765 RepID=E4Y9H6_OIKDI|nr:unnamed protein product [Oikopleura dioica]
MQFRQELLIAWIESFTKRCCHYAINWQLSSSLCAVVLFWAASSNHPHLINSFSAAEFFEITTFMTFARIKENLRISEELDECKIEHLLIPRKC